MYGPNDKYSRKDPTGKDVYLIRTDKENGQTERLLMTREIVKRIADHLGHRYRDVRDWLVNGETMETSFSLYKRDN